MGDGKNYSIWKNLGQASQGGKLKDMTRRYSDIVIVGGGEKEKKNLMITKKSHKNSTSSFSRASYRLECDHCPCHHRASYWQGLNSKTCCGGLMPQIASDCLCSAYIPVCVFYIYIAMLKAYKLDTGRDCDD